MSKLLTHEQILAAMERREVATTEVHIPELGGSVKVREMSGSLRNRLEATYATIRGGGDAKALDTVTAQIVAMCVLDDSDRPMMTVNEVKRLAAACPKAVFRMREAIIDISATDQSDLEDLEQVFDGAQSEPSSSD